MPHSKAVRRSKSSTLRAAVGSHDDACKTYICSVVDRIIAIGDVQNLGALFAYAIDEGIVTTDEPSAKRALADAFLLLLPHIRLTRLDRVVREAGDRMIDTVDTMLEGERQDAEIHAAASARTAVAS